MSSGRSKNYWCFHKISIRPLEGDYIIHLKFMSIDCECWSLPKLPCMKMYTIIYFIFLSQSLGLFFITFIFFKIILLIFIYLFNIYFLITTTIYVLQEHLAPRIETKKFNKCLWNEWINDLYLQSWKWKLTGLWFEEERKKRGNPSHFRPS